MTDITLKVKVKRWGNSLVAPIPASLARDAGVKEGDWVEVTLHPE